jgi:hypothetical protein
MTRSRRVTLYGLCTAIILLGFVMLIQPLSMLAFTWGWPVMIAGIIVHIILDHLPEARDEKTAIRSDKGAG